MSQLQTSGYDILVQLSEEELNAQVKVLLPSVLFSFQGTDATFDHLELDITAPAVPNGVRLFLNVQGSNISGTIDFVAQIDARTSGPKRVLGIYFIDPAKDSQIHPNLNPSLANGLAKSFLETWLSQQSKPYITLREFDPAGSTDPLVPTDVHVKTIDNLAGSYDCVTLMLNTGGSTGGDPAGVTQYLGSGPTGAVVTLSNHLLLSRLIKPRLAAALNATFVDECQLANPVWLPITSLPVSALGFELFRIDVSIYLASMNVTVEGNALRVAGSLGGGGNGWHINDATFSFPLSIKVTGGQLDVEQLPSVVTVSLGFDWWVWLMSGLTFGGLGLFVTAAIQYAVNAVITDSLLPALSSIASGLGLNGIAPSSVPLVIPGGTLTLQSVLLDDLILEGPVTATPATAAGLALQGDLYLSRTVTTTRKNGVLVTGLGALMTNGGDHFVITRRFAYRGLFAAVPSQPVYPATFSWSLAGAQMVGTGTFLNAQLSPEGNLEVKAFDFQVAGAHCWIWTEAGAKVPAFPLTLTMVDGAGHSSTASITLSREGFAVDDFISEPMTVLGPNVVLHPVTAGGTVVLTGALGLISPVVDRREELSAAFKKGLSTKQSTATPPKTGATPPKTGPATPPMKN